VFEFLSCTLCYTHNGDASTQDFSPKLIALENRVLGRIFDPKKNEIRADCR